MTPLLFTLGIHAIILTVSSLAACVAYNVGLRNGRKRGVKDGLAQAAETQRQSEKMVAIHDEQGIQRSGQVSG